MSKLMMRVYSAAPNPMRSLLANLHGIQLRWRRYGSQTEQLIEEALEREQWTSEQWRRWQQDRLARVLHHAATRVPHYRKHWEERRRRGDQSPWEELDNWPILQKESLRQDPRSFLADNCRSWKMYQEYTSGSTGTPVRLWKHRKTLHEWHALFEARALRWYGVSKHDRWASLGGKLVTPVRQNRPPYWVWNASLRQLYMSSYHLSADRIPDYLNALRRYRVIYLLGYTSALYELTQETLFRDRQDLQMKVVITNGEPVFDYQRKAIEKAFQCPVRETYGMSELAAAAGECEAGGLHLWPEMGIVEVLNHGQAVLDQTPGDFVMTGLLNTDMPLIRYRIGDRGAMAPEGKPCKCGRSLPMLQSIEGRTDDLLHAPDGRRIGRLDPVFKADLPIREAQIIQETLTNLRVRYVPTPEFTPRHGREIIDHLRMRMGDVQVTLEEVSTIPRTANGKFRAVICNLKTPLSQEGLSPDTSAPSRS